MSHTKFGAKPSDFEGTLRTMTVGATGYADVEDDFDDLFEDDTDFDVEDDIAFLGEDYDEVELDDVLELCNVGWDDTYDA